MPEYLLHSPNQSIYTDFSGNSSLLGFYNFAKSYSNCWITLNFDGINFMDANLCSLLYSIIFDLRVRKNVKTFIDFKAVKTDLNVFNRNGFLTHVAGNQFVFKPFDNRDSTIPLLAVSQDDVDGFCGYIEKDFLHQRGLDAIKFQDKERVKSSYFEIFENVSLHANTSDPIFVCGQYFPKQSELKFTFVDLGEGFLKKIAEFTKNTERITTSSKAIDWAVSGNSTKKGVKGGTGLNSIFKFCMKTGGSIHILSGDCYYNITNKSITTHAIPSYFKGTTIHLIFRYLQNGK